MALDSFRPAFGMEGTPVALSGKGFSGATQVLFGAIPSKAFRVISDTAIEAVVPPGHTSAPGSVSITVVAPDGKAEATTAFAVEPRALPLLDPIAEATVIPGARMVLAGTHFAEPMEVYFGGVQALDVKVDSQRQLSVTVPFGAADGPLLVRNPAGEVSSSVPLVIIKPHDPPPPQDPQNQPAPILDRLTPESGPIGTIVTIDGKYFTGVTGVWFDGTAASPPISVSDTVIRAVVPAGATTGLVRVKTPAGVQPSARPFNVTAAPLAVTGFAPHSGAVGTRVTLQGTGFAGATQVRFGGGSGTAPVSVSDTVILVDVPAGAATGPIHVNNPAVSVASTAAFQVIVPPVVTGFTPPAGAAGTRVTITGIGLAGVTQVRFGGGNGTAPVAVSDTGIQVDVPAGGATGPIQVSNPAGSVASTTAFQVIVRPVVTGFTPPAGAAGTRVTLTGIGFAGVTRVRFGGGADTAPVAVSDTGIQVDVPAGGATGRIQVSNSAGNGDSPLDFNVLRPPAITALEPPHGMAGATVAIRGARLAGVTRVVFANGAVGTILGPVADTVIRVRVPAGAADGPIAVEDPVGRADSGTPFKLLAAVAPELSAMNPAHGIPGTRVTVTGRNLLGIIYASFGGSPAPFESVSDTQIIVTVPDAANTSKINARTDRSATRVETTTRFVVDPPPPAVIHSFHPVGGKPGETVVITGQHFHWISEVKFGRYTVPAADWTVDSPGRITAKVPLHSVPGNHTVTLVRLRGGVVSVTAAPAQFRIRPPVPVIARVCPPQSRPGFEVIIKGSGFTRNSTRVWFNHLASPLVRRLNGGEMTAEVPAGATTGFIQMVTPQGRAESPAIFAVDASPLNSSDVFIDGWHITQGTQDYLGTVPLVAGRSGLLRVFVRANRNNTHMPVVRITFEGGSLPAWTRDIPAPRTVPQAIDEGVLGNSWNLDIPANVLVAGRTIKLELDPAGTIPHADRSGNARTFPLDVRVLPVPRFTLIPIRHGVQEGNVDAVGRTLLDWTGELYKLYPLADLPGGVDAVVAPVFLTPLAIGTYNEAVWSELVDALDAERTRLGETDRIYVGVIHHAAAGGSGLTLHSPGSASGLMVCLVSDGAPGFKTLFAHEAGHAMGLLHAPFGAPDNVRGYWPEDLKYDQGNIGVWGYDLGTHALRDPTTHKDIMSYGPLLWISDFSYRKVITFLENHP